MTLYNTKESTQTMDEAVVQEVELKKIVIFNDDVNTFDNVIDALVDLCGHTPVQAEQCAWITHLKGKCHVKSGEYEVLEPVCSEILRRGINAEIH